MKRQITEYTESQALFSTYVYTRALAHTLVPRYDYMHMDFEWKPFKVILHFIGRVWPAWIRDCVSKTKTNKQNPKYTEEDRSKPMTKLTVEEDFFSSLQQSKL